MEAAGISTAEAYARGLAEGAGAVTETDAYAPLNLTPYEIAEACASWRAAIEEHGHRSFYGVAHIRAMRAYWLGRRRSIRAGVPRFAPCAIYGGPDIRGARLWRVRDRLTGAYVPADVGTTFSVRAHAETSAARLNAGARLLAEMRAGYEEVTV